MLPAQRKRRARVLHIFFATHPFQFPRVTGSIGTKVAELSRPAVGCGLDPFDLA